jgi:hypothetical protein
MKELKSSPEISTYKDCFELFIELLMAKITIIKRSYSFQNNFTEFEDFLK